MKLCNFHACTRKVVSRGLCDSHYRQYLAGKELSPLKGPQGQIVYTLEYLFDRTKRVGDCMEWTGCKTGSGYGQLSHNGKKVPAHRMAYELHNGQPVGRQVIHHKCHNRLCINPSHLQIASHAENLLEMFAKKSLEARIEQLESRVEELEAELDSYRRGVA
jgi:hypothetical protein